MYYNHTTYNFNYFTYHTHTLSIKEYNIKNNETHLGKLNTKEHKQILTNNRSPLGMTTSMVHPSTHTTEYNIFFDVGLCPYPISPRSGDITYSKIFILEMLYLVMYMF